MERSLSRAAYWDDAFFTRERAAIFRNEWVLVGRADELREPGDFRIVEVADEDVIVVRGAAGALHAHLNFCRHRGSRLLCGEGTLRGAIRCPYHAWAYAFDGRLIATPFMAAEEVPSEIHRLHAVDLAAWGGFVFVRLDREKSDGSVNVTLAEQLGATRDRIARYPLAELHVGLTRAYEVAANRKVILENYNECYHCAGVHPELCRIVPAFKSNGGAGLDWENGIAHRTGATTFTFSGTTKREPFAGLNEFERSRHKGELIYPNFMLSLASDHVAVYTLTPRTPALTTVSFNLLFHPTEMAKPTFDPTDSGDFWDLVNRQDWRICESVQAGMRSRAFEHGYYAPMEDASLDIRRYLAARMNLDA